MGTRDDRDDLTETRDDRDDLMGTRDIRDDLTETRDDRDDLTETRDIRDDLTETRDIRDKLSKTRDDLVDARNTAPASNSSSDTCDARNYVKRSEPSAPGAALRPPTSDLHFWYHRRVTSSSTPPKRILLTNDDGIRSPGLWAAAEALAQLGEVTVVAPRLQSSGAGRSLPAGSEGRIHPEQAVLNGRTVTAYAVDGTPAQAVQHGLVELMDPYPDLIVAGINYGENVGSGVTISGTVGATLEGASFGVPGLAVSLQTTPEYHLSHSDVIDFSTAAFFARKFAALLLGLDRVSDVDVLKVEVPEGATPHTPWRVTRLSRSRYYLPSKPPTRASWTDPGHIGYRLEVEPDRVEPDSDVGALVAGVVSVTPLSLDLTSRVDLSTMTDLFGRALPPGQDLPPSAATAAD